MTAAIRDSLAQVMSIFDRRVTFDGRLVFATQNDYEAAMRASFDLLKEHGPALLAVVEGDIDGR